MAEKKKAEGGALEITPVTILWEKILMLPITGVIDSKRAQEIMETVLAKISQTSSKILILDILGVATVDSAVANHILKITKATQLMGCTSIITGISPTISQILVHLGVELRDIVTRSALRDGLEVAFDVLGLEVREIKEPSKKRGGGLNITSSLLK